MTLASGTYIDHIDPGSIARRSCSLSDESFDKGADSQRGQRPTRAPASASAYSSLRSIPSPMGTLGTLPTLR